MDVDLLVHLGCTWSSSKNLFGILQLNVYVNTLLPWLGHSQSYPSVDIQTTVINIALTRRHIQSSKTISDAVLTPPTAMSWFLKDNAITLLAISDDIDWILGIGLMHTTSRLNRRNPLAVTRGTQPFVCLLQCVASVLVVVILCCRKFHCWCVVSECVELTFVIIVVSTGIT